MRVRFGIALAAIALIGGGCATKKYVGQEVGTVSSRVDDVQGQVEENQTGVRRNRETIERQGQDIQKTSKTAQEALDRALAAGKLAEGKLLYEVALTDDKVRFAFDKAALGDEAQTMLSDFANQLKSENKNVYVEIQGHTDGVGSEDYNYRLGLDRAEAVRRFLNQQGIPLHRMSVISYGETAPVADNSTREGRAQNRRVVLVVLE
jgi:peptidoglycan-associated lipoprotein